MRKMHATGCAVLTGAVMLFVAGPAAASENGATVYLLGSGGPGNAVMPPVQGVFLDNEFYYAHLDANAEKQFPINGNVIAGLDGDLIADFPTVVVVPTTNFLGGTLMLGGAIPFGTVMVNARAKLTGPFGGTRNFSLGDSATVIGDPIVTGALGWKSGNTHFQLSTLANVPIGTYRAGELANLAFHRWAVDVSGAVSWHQEAGWDLSAKAGVTFNGRNDVTDYKSGDDFHAEGSIEKKLTKQFSLGLIGYYYKQISDDTGSGAKLGPFRGETVGAGGTVAWDFMFTKKTPATLRVRAFTEFETTNRPSNTSVWIGLSLPLSMKLPAGAGGAH